MNRIYSATLEETTFRQGDSPGSHFQKLEKLRQAVAATTGAHTGLKSLELSITGGLPTTNVGPLYRLRIPVDRTLTILGPITADARVAATATTILTIKKDGVPNGSITFVGTVGTGAAINLVYPSRSLFEIWSPVVADLTLDDVSLSIPISFR